MPAAASGPDKRARQFPAMCDSARWAVAGPACDCGAEANRDAGPCRGAHYTPINDDPPTNWLTGEPGDCRRSETAGHGLLAMQVSLPARAARQAGQ